MAIEMVILVPLYVVSVCLVYYAYIAAARRRLLMLSLTIAGFLMVQFVAYKLFGPDSCCYYYETTHPECQPYEFPLKGESYDQMLQTYEKHRRLHADIEMFRTFEKDWSNVYRWHDYMTHPRWRWPYRPRRQ